MTQSTEVQTITSSELKRNTGEHMDHVLKGGAILVTRNGRALGFIIPAKLTEDGVAVPDISA